MSELTPFLPDHLSNHRISVVASIEETAERYSIPKPFIGLILLPLVSNAAEHVTSVWMAMKDKMELTIGICVGSSIVRFLSIPPELRHSPTSSTANRRLCYSATRHCWLGHWPRPHSFLRQF